MKEDEGLVQAGKVNHMIRIEVQQILGRLERYVLFVHVGNRSIDGGCVEVAVECSISSL